MRDLLEEHSNNPPCSICHKLFDPVGLGLENYDGYGRLANARQGQADQRRWPAAGHRLRRAGRSGELLGESPEVSECLVVQWFRYTFGRDPLPTDGCTLQQLKTAFMRDGRSLQALLQATVETDAFRTRIVTVGGGL